MSLINTLRSIGAEVSNVSVAYRNKETGEAVRGAQITGGSIDVFTDPTLRLNALSTCSGKSIGLSVTDPSNPNETVSAKVNPVDIAAAIARESGLMTDYERLLAMRDDGSSLETLAQSTASIMDASRNQAAIVRNAITKQAQAAIAKRSQEPSKPASKKPEITVK